MSHETESSHVVSKLHDAELPLSVYRALLDSMSEGVSLASEDGVIVYTNPAEDRMFGYRRGELIGRHVSVQNAYPADTNARVVAEVISELKQNGVWRGEWLNRRQDGSTFVSTSRITAVTIEGRPHWLCVQDDVTSERLGAHALRDSESRLGLATSAAQLGIWDWDVATGRFVYSTRARQICGFEPDEEITYEKVQAVTHPDDFPRTSAQASRALDPAIRDSSPFEYRVIRRDGSVRYVIAYGEAAFAEVNGKMKAIRYVGTLQDVTDRHELQQGERAASQRLRLALEASGVAVWELDLRSGILAASADMNRILGFAEDSQPTAEEIRARYYPGEQERVAAIREHAISSGERTYEAEFRFVRPDGDIRWLQMRAELTRDESGSAQRAVGVLADVTSRKNAELHQSVLAEISKRTREMDDPAEISYAAAAILGRALNVSRAGYGTIDKAAETITIERDWNAPGIRTLAGVLHFRDYGSYIEDLKRGETVVFEDAYLDPRTQAGAAALKAISAQAVVNMPVTEHGGFVALLYLNHASARRWSEAELLLIKEAADQTRIVVERRRAEHRLRDMNLELEQRVENALAERRLLAEVVESTDARVHILDLQYRWLGINQAAADEFQRIYGTRPRVGGCVLDLLAHLPEQGAATKALWDRVLNGEEFTVVSEFGDPNIERRHYEMKFNVLRDRSGERIGAFVFVYDVTERFENQRRLAEAEAALIQSQKMEAMGQLTGGVAHDFNNLLTPIIGGLDMLQRRVIGDERTQRMIAGALASAERAQTLVQRLLAFARRQPLQPAAVDLAALATDMGALIESTTGPHIGVAVDTETATAHAIADANQLEMALLNLAVNSRDAMPRGGSLTIRVRERLLQNKEFGLPAGRYVSLAVIDTGEGMDAATLARAIEPFFSTKGIGKGTGLGLSMVHGLAAQLGGAFSIESELGKGTTVELLLPVADARNEHAEAVVDNKRPLRSSGVAALIDDEALVRASTSEMLKDLGYTVIEFESAEVAHRNLDVHAIDIVVTDHLMPGMTGADLARDMRRRRPDLPILIVSGYADVEGIASDLPRLTKPFRQNDLAASLAALLGSG